mgnify:CR=1 FL=1
MKSLRTWLAVLCLAASSATALAQQPHLREGVRHGSG